MYLFINVINTTTNNNNKNTNTHSKYINNREHSFFISYDYL